MPQSHVITPRPGDIIVWRVDKDFTGDLLEVMRDVRAMFPRNQVIVTNDATPEVWTDEDLARLGLQRIPPQQDRDRPKR